MTYSYSKKILTGIIVSICFCNTTYADANINTGTTSSVYDDPIADFINNIMINGDIRSYYFTRDYTNPNAIDQSAYSLGGNLRILTPPVFGGFQAGAAVYTAQELGLNSDNPKQVDQTLPGNDVTVLGQAYLQFQNKQWLIRAGDQLINTPWMNAADSRMIPATYRGIYGSWSPQPNISFIALRITDFKSRTSDEFNGSNLYSPGNPGDTPISGLQGDSFPGAQAVGTTFKTSAFNTQLWGYQFFDFGRLLYGDAQYTFNQSASIHPFIGAQFVREWGDGDNVLQQVSNGAANATAFGAQLGAESSHLRLTASYNKIFSQDGYNNGDIVSPYTSGYTSDPLYTTSMIAGLIEKSSGDAIKIAGTLFALDKQIQFTTSFARYFTSPNVANTNETDLDLTYNFPKSSRLKGLSIRNRLGILTGNPNNGTFYYNRLMVQYSF